MKCDDSEKRCTYVRCAMVTLQHTPLHLHGSQWHITRDTKPRTSHIPSFKKSLQLCSKTSLKVIFFHKRLNYFFLTLQLCLEVIFQVAGTWCHWWARESKPLQVPYRRARGDIMRSSPIQQLHNQGDHVKRRASNQNDTVIWRILLLQFSNIVKKDSNSMPECTWYLNSMQIQFIYIMSSTCLSVTKTVIFQLLSTHQSLVLCLPITQPTAASI